MSDPPRRQLSLSVGTNADNTPVIGPAGTVHMSLTDLATYAHEHLLGRSAQGKLLEQVTYERLHQSNENDYAFGWVSPSSDELGVGDIIWHNGSNTMWYAFVAVLPTHNAVFAMTVNDGRVAIAEKAALDLLKRLFEQP